MSESRVFFDQLFSAKLRNTLAQPIRIRWSGKKVQSFLHALVFALSNQNQRL